MEENDSLHATIQMCEDDSAIEPSSSMFILNRTTSQQRRPQEDPLAPPNTTLSTSLLLPSSPLSEESRLHKQPFKKPTPVYRLILDGQKEDGTAAVDELIARDYQLYHSCDSNLSKDAVDTAHSTDTDSPVGTPPGFKAVYCGAVANLCNATLGAGILSLPIAFYQSGLIIGFALLLGSGWATMASIQLLIKVCIAYDVYTYEGLVHKVLGRSARLATELCIVTFGLGCAVAYIIAVGDILEQAGLIFPGENGRAWSIVAVWGALMFPLCLLRTMQHLQFASVFGIASIGTLVFSTLVHLIQDETYSGGNTAFNVTNNSAYNFWGMEDVSSSYSFWSSAADAFIKSILSSNSSDLDGSSNQTFHEKNHYHHHHIQESFLTFLWPSKGITSVLLACPIIVFAYSCQVNVCPIYQELPDPPPRDEQEQDEDETPTFIRDKPAMMNLVAFGQLLICSILYAGIACFALADFGSRVTPNILSAYSNDDDSGDDDAHTNYNRRRHLNTTSQMMQVAEAAMAAAVIVAFPLNIFPARESLAGLLRLNKKRRVLSDSNNLSSQHPATLQHQQQVQNPVLTVALLEDQDLFVAEKEAAIAAASPSSSSSSSSSPTSLSALISQSRDSSNAEKMGFSMLPDSTESLLDQCLETGEANCTHWMSTAATNDTLQLPEIQQQQQQQQQISIALELSEFHHFTLTFLLAGMSLSLGLLIPDLSVVFGLLGGTTSSALGFIIPGALGIQLCRREDHLNDFDTWVLSWGLLVGGTIIGILTTTVTLLNTVA